MSLGSVRVKDVDSAWADVVIVAKVSLPNSHQKNKFADVSEKIIDESLEKYNISGTNSLVDKRLVDIDAIKREEYERGVADTVLKYQPLLAEATLDVQFATLLQEKLSSVVQ